MPQVASQVSRTLPTPVADGQPAVSRGGRYGEFTVTPVMPDIATLCMEGTYRKATHQTPGTTVADNIQTTFLNTKGLLNIRNTDGANGKQIIMDYIKLICTGAPASATATDISLAIDNAIRYASGGTQFTPQNPNMDMANASIATLWFGALTLNAPGANVRYISRAKLFQAIEVVGTEFILVFNRPAGASGVMNGSAPQRLEINVGPCILGPNNNENLSIHTWRAANATTAPTYEFEIGWWER